jgi:hypothetical protein
MIDAGGRWDAVALLRSLADRHAYLVQEDGEHWRLHLECDDVDGELAAGLESRIGRWLADRSRRATSLRRGDGDRIVVRQPAMKRERDVRSRGVSA